MTNELIIVGGGLAGTEAAWQAAEAGIDVRLYEMRPRVQTPAHETPWRSKSTVYFAIITAMAFQQRSTTYHYRYSYGCNQR